VVFSAQSGLGRLPHPEQGALGSFEHSIRAILADTSQIAAGQWPTEHPGTNATLGKLRAVEPCVAVHAQDRA